MISQSAFAGGAGAAEVGGAAAVVAGAAAVADGQGVAVAEVAGAGIVAGDPAGDAAAGVTVAAGAGAAEALPAPSGVAPAVAGAGAAAADPAAAGPPQGFAGAAVLAEASSTVLMRGVMTAAIPTPSTTARSPIISAGRARGGRSSWLRYRRAALRYDRPLRYDMSASLCRGALLGRHARPKQPASITETRQNWDIPPADAWACTLVLSMPFCN